MSASNSPAAPAGNASIRTYPQEQNGKTVSEAKGTEAQASVRAETATTSPNTAPAVGRLNDLNASMSYATATGGRHHDHSPLGTYGAGNMSMTGGYGSLSLAPHRRKRTDGGTTMTLYVRGKDSALSDANTHDASSLSRENAGATHRGGANGSTSKSEGTGKAAEPPESMTLSLVDGALSAVTSASEKVAEGAPSFVQALTKPAITAAAIFVFFLLANIYTVMQARRVVENVLESTAAVNDQMLSVATGLAEQHAVKRAYADALAEPFRNTPQVDVERVMAEAQHLASAKNRSVHALRKHLAYPGPVADVEFLVDQHVSYELHLQELVEAELAWMRVAQNTLRTRTLARRTSKVVIGDNAEGSYLDSIATEARRHLEHMTYPLSEEREARRLRERLFHGEASLGDGSDSDDGRAASGRGTKGSARTAGTGGEYDPTRGLRVDGTASSAAKCSKKNCKPSAPQPAERGTRKLSERAFDAFVEVQSGVSIGNSPRGSRSKLDEVIVSEHAKGEPEEEMQQGHSLAKRLLGNRLFVFVALCALMFLYFRVG